jgi:spermidine synthase
MPFEIQPTLRGYRINQNGCVLSEILKRPGATNSVFDVLAAATAIMAPGRAVGLLGFAGGGMVAPLRKAGSDVRVRAVDLSRQGYDLFHKVSASWCDDVEFTEGDAVKWLQEGGRDFDVLIEDLSVPVSGDVEKPEICWTVLPQLIRSRIRPGGVVITNMLRSAGMTWPRFMPPFAEGYRRAVVVHLREFENRILVAGNFSQSTGWISRRLRKCLAAIGSDQASQFRLSTLK